jgi:hypothetical protein
MGPIIQGYTGGWDATAGSQKKRRARTHGLDLDLDLDASANEGTVERCDWT